MCKTTAAVSFFVETHCFSNLHWDNMKWRWMREDTSVSGSLSVQWAATDTSSVPYYWPYKGGIKWPLPTSAKMRWVAFLRTPLALALPYQQREPEKYLPLGGAAVILEFKFLPSTLETASLARVTVPAHQVLPTRQELPASAHKTGTEQARRTNSTSYKTQVRLLDIKIVCHSYSSLGQSKVSSEASVEKWVTQVQKSYQLPWSRKCENQAVPP